MIELYDIIDAANYPFKNGMLVLHKSMKIHPKFKMYKQFCYNLYYINGDNKTSVLDYEETKTVATDNIEEVWNEYDKAYLVKFIKWLTSDDYKSIVENDVQ